MLWRIGSVSSPLRPAARGRGSWIWGLVTGSNRRRSAYSAAHAKVADCGSWVVTERHARHPGTQHGGGRSRAGRVDRAGHWMSPRAQVRRWKGHRSRMRHPLKVFGVLSRPCPPPFTAPSPFPSRHEFYTNHRICISCIDGHRTFTRQHHRCVAARHPKPLRGSWGFPCPCLLPCLLPAPARIWTCAWPGLYIRL